MRAQAKIAKGDAVDWLWHVRSLLSGHRLRVALALGAVIAGLIGARAGLASTTGWRVERSLSVKSASLHGATASSRSNAWAVGSYYNGTAIRTLIEHWNGNAWKVKPSPNPSPRRFPEDELMGVAATSRTNAWAVGFSQNNNNTKTLIERWDGKDWQVEPSPNPGTLSSLSSVAAISPTNAWAVGSYGDYGRTLIEHWDGTAWKIEPSPNPNLCDSGDVLTGVAATSATNAWAVGDCENFSSGSENSFRSLILQWNGRAWTTQRRTNANNSTHLVGVAATSATNVWAVGFDDLKGERVIQHWNGKAWRVQTIRGGRLLGVATTSAANAWAVGHHIHHWNGKAWKLERSATCSPAAITSYSGVAATSPTNAWAVGKCITRGPDRTLIEHWNGRTWRLQPSP